MFNGTRKYILSIFSAQKSALFLILFLIKCSYAICPGLRKFSYGFFETHALNLRWYQEMPNVM